MALSPGDPSSYSRPDQMTTKHIHLDLDINFEKKILSGICVLTIEKVEATAETLFLDCRDLQITSVKCEDRGIDLTYKVDGKTPYGSCLQIQLALNTGMAFKIRIKYMTSPSCSALQWLAPEQTAGKKLPYVFSQCQAIHCRSMVPCQDTPSVKATYTASMTAPTGITVLMSAIRNTGPVAEGSRQRFTFKQPIPIQSYLIALAAGALESKQIGPRTLVWSEKEFVEKAAFEFSETETMLATAEELCGPYVWGAYDILVLPPSFPYGGMENPCLTFATPTLISGDKANADVIAHEIAHSWTGNLVTNKSFEHFWLNEGFTVFVERKIKGRMHGEPFRHFSAILRWPELEETVNQLYGPDNPLTRLVPDLRGVDPDDAFSVIPYEKGSTFLWYLEELVGGATKFEPFLRAYYTAFAYKSIDSEQFKHFFLKYFDDVEACKTINWDRWFYSPGMPCYKPKFDDSLVVACQELANRWTAWQADTDCPFNGKELEHFSSDEKQAFLTDLLKGKPLAVDKLKKMDELYQLGKSQNKEIVFRWVRLGIAARWKEIIPLAVKLVTEQGRMKFVRPIYRDLYAWEEQRKVALSTFKENKDEMMAMARDMVAKDLHLNTNDE